ncbi:hypothetical protein B0H12DRAFT_1074342 [Mycena haematopus]|nr:hypothetical protein B0H12DRAFT_1074342 [Mycena haematopus]
MSIATLDRYRPPTDAALVGAVFEDGQRRRGAGVVVWMQGQHVIRRVSVRNKPRSDATPCRTNYSNPSKPEYAQHGVRQKGLASKSGNCGGWESPPTAPMRARISGVIWQMFYLISMAATLPYDIHTSKPQVNMWSAHRGIQGPLQKWDPIRTRDPSICTIDMHLGIPTLLSAEVQYGLK